MLLYWLEWEKKINSPSLGLFLCIIYTSVTTMRCVKTNEFTIIHITVHYKHDFPTVSTGSRCTDSRRRRRHYPFLPVGILIVRWPERTPPPPATALVNMTIFFVRLIFMIYSFRCPYNTGIPVRVLQPAISINKNNITIII